MLEIANKVSIHIIANAIVGCLVFAMLRLASPAACRWADMAVPTTRQLILLTAFVMLFCG